MILYFCNQTATDGVNSGIQKVTRFAAKSFLKLEYNLLPVTIKNDDIKIIPRKDLLSFAKNGGPSLDSWRLNNIDDVNLNDVEFAILPDLVYGDDFENIIKFCHINKIKLYTIFYDAVPIILADKYYKSNNWNLNHENYMNKIAKYSSIMGISKSAVEQFKTFITSPVNIKDISLPSNFIEGVGIEEKINHTKNIEILYVSSIEGRKNHKTLVKAFEIAWDRLRPEGFNLKLNLVGNTAEFWREQIDLVKDAEKRMPVKWYEGQSDEQVLNFYRNADFTVYPSELEGFGLPVIESLFNNTPCIVANNSSLKEVGSLGGCVMFDTMNAEDFAKKIIRLSRDAEFRHKLVEQIKDITPYTWEDYVNKIVKFARETNKTYK